MENQKPQPLARLTKYKYLIPLAALLLLIAWMIYTPPGILGKADAVGYAVCHRIPERTFFLDDRPIPLCARCTGMHLGAILALFYQFPFGKKGKLPPRWIMVLLGIFLVAFGIDGVNSYSHFFPQIPHLYQPQNILRLITGTGLGIGIGLVLYPVFNQTAWIDWEDQPAVSSWKQMLVLLAAAALIDLAILSEIPLLLFPLAILSSLNVILILTLIYAILWVMAIKKDNTYHTWRGFWVVLCAGLLSALVQISIMDFVRLRMTGTWGSFL